LNEGIFNQLRFSSTCHAAGRLVGRFDSEYPVEDAHNALLEDLHKGTLLLSTNNDLYIRFQNKIFACNPHRYGTENDYVVPTILSQGMGLKALQ
jgi:hypothetical protein